MKINFANLYEGWRNLLIPPEELKEKIAEVAKERLNICSTCKWNSKFHNSIRPDEYCTKCKCTLSAKTVCLSCKCPLPIPKWKAVLTDDEEIFLKTRDDERNNSK